MGYFISLDYKNFIKYLQKDKKIFKNINDLLKEAFQVDYDIHNISTINMKKNTISWIKNGPSNAIYLLYIQNNNIIGLLRYYIQYLYDPRINIESLCVSKDFRRLNIGTKILKYCIETECKCLLKSRNPVTIEVLQQNKRALTFYKKYGFKIIKKLKDEKYNYYYYVMDYIYPYINKKKSRSTQKIQLSRLHYV